MVCKQITVDCSRDFGKTATCISGFPESYSLPPHCIHSVRQPLASVFLLSISLADSVGFVDRGEATAGSHQSLVGFPMNKLGGGGLGGTGVGLSAKLPSGPTVAAAAAAAQKQKGLMQRADTDINTILDNFSLLIKAARISDAPFRNSQEAFQMEIHASRVVQAADSLLKLVSELKQTAVFSDFASLTEHVEQRVQLFEQQCDETDQLLATVGEQAAASLKELESHYYSSVHRTPE